MDRIARSLRSKLLLLFLLVAVVPLSAATLLAVRNSRATVERQVGNAQARIAGQVAQRVDLAVADRVAGLVAASNGGDLVAAVLGMGDSTGTRASLARLRDGTAGLRAVRLYDANGELVAASGDAEWADAPAAAGAAWFAGASDAAQVYVSAVERDAAGGQLVRLADGVRTSSGSLLGVLVADLDWSVVAREAFASLEASFREDGILSARAFLVDSAGHVMASTTDADVLARRLASEALLEAMGHDATGSMVTELEGESSLVAFAPVRRDVDASRFGGVLGNEGWVLVTEDAAEAFVAATTLGWQLAFVSLVAAGAVGVFAWWLAGSIAGPLASAAELAERLAEGDTSREIDASDRRDEAGRLNAALRQLLGYMRELTAASEKLAAGDMQIAVTPKGDRDELSRAFLTVAATNAQLIDTVSGVTRNALEGELAARADAAAFQGSYRALVEGVNRTLDAVMEPIDEASRVLQRLAERDLSARVQGHYRGDHARITDALNRAAGNLDAALTDVWATAEQVAAASSQIGTGSHALAEGANEQASTLEEVSSSLHDLTNRTQQNAGNALTARSLADEARTSAETGTAGMGRLQDAMSRIKTSSDSTARIVKTIDEIAFQTNLLALNAAVEAARAGDAGRGFAVVAEEVRALALRSAEAAKSTAALIEEAVQNADGGVAINAEVLRQLGDINTRIVKVREVMGEIASASEEQSGGVSQISQAVSSMNAVTQQVAANSQESAATAQQLAAQASVLRSTLSRFTLTAAAAATPARPARPAPSAPAARPSASARAATNGRPTSPGKPAANGRLASAGRPAAHAAPAPSTNGRHLGTPSRLRAVPPPNGRGVGPVDPASVIPFDEDDDQDVLGDF